MSTKQQEEEDVKDFPVVWRGVLVPASGKIALSRDATSQDIWKFMRFVVNRAGAPPVSSHTRYSLMVTEKQVVVTIQKAPDAWGEYMLFLAKEGKVSEDAIRDETKTVYVCCARVVWALAGKLEKAGMAVLTVNRPTSEPPSPPKSAEATTTTATAQKKKE